MDIPANSFTAHRLTYTLTDVLNHATTLVLIGGIPEQWYSKNQKFNCEIGNDRVEHGGEVTGHIQGELENIMTTTCLAQASSSLFSEVSGGPISVPTSGTNNPVVKITDADGQELVLGNRMLLNCSDGHLKPQMTQSTGALIDSLTSTMLEEELFMTAVELVMVHFHEPEAPARTILRPVSPIPVELPYSEGCTRDRYKSNTSQDTRDASDTLHTRGFMSETAVHAREVAREHYANARLVVNSAKIQNRFKRVFGSKTKGEIIRLERMLVMVKEFNGNPASFLEEEPVETRVTYRWHELQAVLKNPSDGNYMLEFYQEKEMKHLQHRVPMVPMFEGVGCRVNFYSQVDKLIALVQHRPKRSPRVLVIVCPSKVLAQRWLFLLLVTLGKEISVNHTIFIPDLKFSIDVKLPVSSIHLVVERQDTLKLTQLDTGYYLEKAQQIQLTVEFIQKELLNRKIKQLNDWIKQIRRPWFAFRQYDRLEWMINSLELFFIENQLMNPDVVTLELRDMELGQAQILETPLAVEGFVMHRRSWYSRRTFDYIHLNQGLLFRCSGHDALPPTSNDDSVEYIHSLYPIDDHGHITWLHPPFNNEKDREAEVEFHRRINLILRLDEVISLARVVKVTSGGTHSVQMTMDNGETITFTSTSAEARDVWVTRLGDAAKYWREHARLLARSTMATKHSNMTHLNIDDYTDSNIYQFVEIGEQRRAIADGNFYDNQAIAALNPVLSSGVLNVKWKKHSHWLKAFVVLIPGYLILFEYSKRSPVTGQVSKEVEHHRYLTIPLSSTYVFLGPATIPDLVNRTSANANQPGRALLARLYVEDGWSLSEEEYMRCLCLWLGSKRHLYGKKVKEEANNPGIARMAAKLGVTGKLILFMARSRQERERWTRDILSEIDREVIHERPQ